MASTCTRALLDRASPHSSKASRIMTMGLSILSAHDRSGFTIRSSSCDMRVVVATWGSCFTASHIASLTISFDMASWWAIVRMTPSGPLCAGELRSKKRNAPRWPCLRRCSAMVVAMVLLPDPAMPCNHTTFVLDEGAVKASSSV